MSDWSKFDMRAMIDDAHGKAPQRQLPDLYRENMMLWAIVARLEKENGRLRLWLTLAGVAALGAFWAWVLWR